MCNSRGGFELVLPVGKVKPMGGSLPIAVIDSFPKIVTKIKYLKLKT
jgi:hypothetical protein